jgi:hypothetical protein
MFYCFEPGVEFDVDSVLPSPSTENKLLIACCPSPDSLVLVEGPTCLPLCLSVWNHSSATLLVFSCVRTGQPSYCIPYKEIIKDILNWNNAFYGFRRIAIIAVNTRVEYKVVATLL